MDMVVNVLYALYTLYDILISTARTQSTEILLPGDDRADWLFILVNHVFRRQYTVEQYDHRHRKFGEMTAIIDRNTIIAIE